MSHPELSDITDPQDFYSKTLDDLKEKSGLTKNQVIGFFDRATTVTVNIMLQESGQEPIGVPVGTQENLRALANILNISPQELRETCVACLLDLSKRHDGQKTQELLVQVFERAGKTGFDESRLAPIVGAIQDIERIGIEGV